MREAADDGYRSPLVLGLKSSGEAARLAEELAFAQMRLERLEAEPPGLYAEIADPRGDLEERTWLAFLIAYLGLLDEGEDPFASVQAVRTSWRAAELPRLEEARTGPRAAHDPGTRTATLEAYRSWAQRAGSQAAAFTAEQAWSAERRFDRVYERLALPGLRRDARYELLTSLGRLGLYPLQPAALKLGGSDTVTLAAKRAFGIGDPLLLERRAAQLAGAAGVALEALDLGLYNWEHGRRTGAGLDPRLEPQPEALQALRSALGL